MYSIQDLVDYETSIKYLKLEIDGLEDIMKFASDRLKKFQLELDSGVSENFVDQKAWKNVLQMKILHSEKKYKEYYDRYSDKKKELEMVEQIIKENAALNPYLP